MRKFVKLSLKPSVEIHLQKQTVVQKKDMNSKNDLEAKLVKAKEVQRKQLVFFAYLLVAAAFIFGGILLYLAKNQNSNSIGSLKSYLYKYKFLDPTRNILEQKDAITNIDPLRKSLRALAEQESSNARISIYFEMLNTGANISINQEEKVFPVSLAKLPLALLVTKKVEDGDFKPEEVFQVTDENLNSNSGELYENVKIGYKVELKKLIREMLVNSDNTAYKILKRNTTLEERKRMADEIGLGELFDDLGKISAKEYSRLLRTLYTASYLNQESSEMILELMSENNFKRYLSQGLPDNVYFSHKHGQNLNLNVYSDSGIVYLENRPYIISAMIEPLYKKGEEGERYAIDLFEKISFETFSYINNK
ncbi:MAG: serine hydrolase [Candidatus Doudnabacteria bacterium]|nr:serine hydrolase [Candidatus Doudnabacteria bacterium]